MVAGVFLSAVGLYQPLADWGGAGATVPLTGFGHALAKGVEKAVAEQGWLGVLTGGLSATAGGITTAVVSAVVMALIFSRETSDKKTGSGTATPGFSRIVRKLSPNCSSFSVKN